MRNRYYQEKPDGGAYRNVMETVETGWNVLVDYDKRRDLRC